VSPTPGAASSASERDTSMTPTYIRVLVIEAAVLALLWLFAHVFS
jgi:hypothetical protein